MTKCANNKELAEKIKKILELERSPVAIKLVKKKEDIPSGIKSVEKEKRHCEMVEEASKGGKFYATCEYHLCKGGAGAIGICEMPSKVKSGEFYLELGRFSSFPAANRCVNTIPKIKERFYASVYAPLEEADFDPDVVVIICKPNQAMKLVQALVYKLGERVTSDFSGIQSVCADAVAGPYTRGKPNFTLGCSGSRQYTGIKDEEIIVGLNGENLCCVVESLESI
ncbi:protein of unknown function DUF169 [Methanothermus fervidus DSM 2088]|uniref:ArCR n=1 Tax=Methanothermus fervidus (strain ATCC 43054 / DSM 2088 / JCM 10308 / V24 S) TaxID=523846 RepID=E3GXV3_METFV|nr:DUF169 domain-containing protein [Methanothermus fervidus]ADP77135.1 protein of unknown function DUF169 [Methanothermus fervidus DSM 2088]